MWIARSRRTWFVGLGNDFVEDRLPRAQHTPHVWVAKLASLAKLGMPLKFIYTTDAVFLCDVLEVDKCFLETRAAVDLHLVLVGTTRLGEHVLNTLTYHR